MVDAHCTLHRRRPQGAGLARVCGSWWKRRRLIRLAQGYLKWMHITEAHCRFDVVAVTPRGDGRFEIRHIPAAFDATGIA